MHLCEKKKKHGTVYMLSGVLQLGYCFFLLQRLIKYKCHLGVGFTVTLTYALKKCVSTGDSSSWRKQVGAEKFNYSPEMSIM